MKPLTREWVQKAEGDFVTAQRELRVRKAPNYDAVCFHAQQCAEKYLKARLQEAERPFPKIHNLLELLKLLSPIEPMLEMLRPSLTPLNRYAVEFRYPGDFATKDEAREAFRLCGHVRSILRERLVLPVEPQDASRRRPRPGRR